MPFGITSASEVFQHAMEELFAGYPCAIIVDDLLVSGEGTADHDVNLKKVLERAREAGMKLQWATKVLRHFVILEYLRQISLLISTILPPPPFSMLDFLSLEFASFLYNIEKGEGGWLSI